MARPSSAPAVMRWGAHPELVGPRHRFRVALMARTLAAHLPPGHGVGPRVLDAGAGRGTLALLLAARGYQVTAVDESAEFVTYVRARAAAVGPGPLGRGATGRGAPAPALDVVQGDVGALPFRAARFDGVACGEVLEHVADDGAALAEFARVLRPGGVLIATVPAGRARYGWLDRWAGHARRYEAGDLRARVERHGFRVVRLHHWGFPFGLLYEQCVQRPVLARHARRGEASTTAVRLGRAGLVTRATSALFRLDHLCDGVPWGPGLLLVVRRAT